MKTHILKGSRREIADSFARIDGEIREVIVIVDEPSDSTPPLPGEDIFAEMEPYTADASAADYSRESIYSRMEGE
ncbi:MAG TPA: hypothetical protein VFE62_17550 [Gemmataceae bacterium]|nr:hypothetical protein [Gemmataceae bacterium]